MIGILAHLVRDEQGQDIIEYGFLAAFLSIVALATIKLLAAPIKSLYETVYNAVKDAFP